MGTGLRGKMLVMVAIAGALALFAGILLIIGALAVARGESLLSPTVVMYCAIGIGVMVPVALVIMWFLRRQILREGKTEVVSEQQGE